MVFAPLRKAVILLLGGSLALFALSTAVCNAIATRVDKDQQVDALVLMQQSAGSTASAVRSIFGGMSELSRLASLANRLRGDSGSAAVLETLWAAMAANSLGVTAVEVRNPDGIVVFSVGPTAGKSTNSVKGPRLSRPSISQDGKHDQRYLISLDGHPGWTISAAFSPIALSAALQSALPQNLSSRAPAVATLLRIPDGVVLARSDSTDLIPENHPELQPRIADPEHAEAGSDRLISVVTGVDSLVGYRKMPELGIAVAVGSPTADVMLMAETYSRQIRHIPYVVLLLCFTVSALLMVLLTRRGAAFALDAERQKTDAEVAARAELDLLVRCSPAMLYRGQLDPQGVYTRDYVTPNSKEVTGWDPEMLSDPERVWKLSAHEDRHLRGTNYLRALKLGRSTMDYRFLRPDGGYSWLRNEAVIVARRPDGSAAVVGAITNITRERELAAQSALQSRMATLGQLSTSLAHELTQPVTVIGMSAAIAQSVAGQMGGDAPREILSQIDQILDQTDRAADMIRHLRSYGHTDSGQLVDVDLGLAVAGAMSLAGAPLREAGVAVHLEMQPNLPQVRARLVQVEQVLVNLMINARDAMQAVPEQARELKLSAACGATIRLSVTDTGPGVPSDVMPRLFEAFYTTKAPGHGTGLGLALCRSLMQSFGGEISVDSSTSGAIFTLEFQRAA